MTGHQQPASGSHDDAAHGTSATDSIVPAAREAMALLRDGRAEAALACLRALPPRPLTATELQPAARLLAALAPALPQLPVLKVALGGDVTLDDLVPAIGWHLLLEGIRLDPLVLPFGTWRQTLRDADSALHRFAPHVLWLFPHARGLREAAARGAPLQAAAQALQDELLDACAAWHDGAARQVVIGNLVPPAWRVLGNLEARLEDSEAQAVRRFNDTLAARLPAGAVLFDLEHLAASHGLAAWHDERLHCHSKHPFAMAAHGPVAQAMARWLLAMRGRSRKCLVLDLDNTLWGGVVGDDGIDGLAIGPDAGARGEAFRAFQLWLKALARSGTVLAVCSKNDEEIARRAIAEAPGMVLGLEDFAAIRANWRNKADNLRELAAELNLGLDAFVFADDNPAERALVRRELPEVAVPELPADPAGYVAALARGRWFEAVTLTDEDRARTQAYRHAQQREQARAAATDLDSYLRSLSMRSRWGAVDAATLARAAQLINKTNQFQLTGTRCTEAELRALCASPDHWVGWFELSDSFGKHGITSIAVLAFADGEARIDTWVMSCRVFARTFEQFIFNRLAAVARGRGATRLRGSYRASAKNGVVRELYPSLGGQPAPDAGAATWLFALDAGGSEAKTHVADANDAAAAPTPTQPREATAP